MSRVRSALSRLGDERGHTLVELLAALAVMTVVLAATLTGLDQFQATVRTTELQNESQDRARLALGSIVRELRNVASPQADQPHGLEKAASDDVVFRSLAEPSGTAPASGGRRVRYCLDGSSPSNGKVWRQVQAWTSSVAPDAPSTTSCPDRTWGDQRLVADRITNSAGEPAAPVWSFDASSVAEIASIRVELHVDVEPDRAPAATRLASGVLLRNQNRSPVADFSATVSGSSHVVLNASAAHDPEGGALEYVWYRDGIRIGTGLTLDHAAPTPGTYSFALRVYDAAGLEGVAEPRSVTIS